MTFDELVFKIIGNLFLIVFVVREIGRAHV